MSWVTVIWSMTAAACLTLALMNFFIWFRQRDAWANLVFSLMAVSIATLAGYELALMRATTTAEFGFVLRWAHVPTWAIILSLVLFVRLYLNAGRWWLLWAICGVRTASLIINFSAGENLNYWHITELQHVSFFEEPVAVAQGVLNQWMLVGQISLVLLAVLCGGCNRHRLAAGRPAARAGGGRQRAVFHHLRDGRGDTGAVAPPPLADYRECARLGHGPGNEL